MISAISVRNARKSYGPLKALDDVSLDIETNEIFGILGRNGAGKTTLVESFVGLTTLDSGSVSILGLDPRTSARKVHELVGVQLQRSDLPEKIRVAEVLKLYASFYRNPCPIDELLDLVDLGDKRKSTWDSLSGGQAQRLSIALALVGRPQVAILDELTSGLDPAARREAWAVLLRLKEQGVTIVLVSHYMEEVEYLCDRVALLDHGVLRLVDTPNGLIDAAGGEQQITFEPQTAVDLPSLRLLPDVRQVDQHGPLVVVIGGTGALSAVIAASHQSGFKMQRLQVTNTSLDTAFLNLTAAPGSEDQS